MVSSSFFILVPLYIYPTSTAWEPLFTAAANYTSLNFKVIVNPDSGPGTTTYPNSDYISNLAKLNSYSNVDTLGYVYVDYASRDLSAVEADVSTYANWAKYAADDIALDGIFFDEAPSAVASLAYMKNATTFAKTTMTATDSGDGIIFNPGAICDSSYYAVANYINAYEGPDGMAAASIVPSAQRAGSAVLVHSFNGTSAQLLANTTAIVKAGLAGMSITTSTDYTSFGTDWAASVADVAAAIASNTTTTTTTATTTEKAKKASRSTLFMRRLGLSKN